jgi:hypothetical protein
MLEPNREIWQFFKKKRFKIWLPENQKKTSVLAIFKGKKNAGAGR